MIDRQRQTRVEGDLKAGAARFEQRMYSPHSIAAIVAELVHRQHRSEDVLDGTDLSVRQLDNHTTRVSYRQLDRVIRNAQQLSDDPTWALQAGLRMHVTAYGMYGYGLLSSGSQDEAREFAAKYVRVIGPLCDFSVSKGGTTVTVVFNPVHWPDPTSAAHRYAVEFALAAHLTATRDWVGSHYAFSRVRLDYAAPAHANAYRELFQCPVLFEQNECGYEHLRDDASVRLADARTHAMTREICEQLLDEVNKAGGIAADIRRILIEQPGRYPTIKAIAERFEMYPRALRRKLEAEGTSYRDLLAEVRQKLAIEYLRKTQMTNEEIAGRLGYSDAANFRHAFIRWTGKNPSDFRHTSRD
jgi:AraC-like DNA-binding protein